MIEVQRPAQTVLTNQAERRKSPRTPIRRLAYVNVEPYDNGGVITDISADGLRFHTVNPVEHGGLVRLSVVLGAANQLQIVGELVWMDESRKVGGVRFTVLPDGAAERILQWAEAANGSTETAIPNVSGSSPAEPAQTGAEPKTRKAWVPPSARPAARNSIGQTGSPAFPSSGPEPPQAWAHPRASAHAAIPPTMPWITHFDPDPPERESLFLRGVLGGFILFIVLGAAAWFGLRHYGGQNGPVRFSNPFASNPAPTGPLASQPDLSPAPSAELPNAAGPTNPASQSPEKTQSASREAPDDAIPETNSDSVPEVSSSQRSALPQTPDGGLAPPTTLSADGRSLPPAPPQPVAKAPGSLPTGAADTGESQLRLAHQYLDGRVQPRNPAVASQLLWSAVEKGNSAAEMDLADLYLHGDGVTRNCDQARVLLSVASGKGNPEAVQKLRELDRSGCR